MEDIERLLVAYLILLATVTGTILVYAHDNIDIDDTLAPMMCKAHGKEHLRTETNLGFGEEPTEDAYLRIYCKDEKKTPLEDGYLILIE